jgi:L-alanine-DL-glutamate epimerase-like enolase superfamily enzyme
VITAVHVRQLEIPFERPLLTASFPIPGVDTVLAEVEGENGTRGIAWIFCFGRRRAAVLKAMVEDLAEVAIGEDELMTQRLWEKMARAVAFIGQRGVAALGMSAIDTACWDLVGKTLGQPVYRLLGGYRGEVEAYASQGLWLDRSRDELVEEARGLLAAGFTGMKLRMGLEDGREDLARARAVREAIGPDVALMVDVNQGWGAKQTIRMGEALAELDLRWLEEPLPFDDLDSYRRIREALDMPLCTGENNFLRADFLRLIEAEAADILMPDLMRVGGVTEWMKIARLCEAHQVAVTPHLFSEVSAHLAAAAPGVIWLEYQPWWSPILAEPLELRDGGIAPGNRPGFGIELDEDAVRRYEVA